MPFCAGVYCLVPFLWMLYPWIPNFPCRWASVQPGSLWRGTCRMYLTSSGDQDWRHAASVTEHMKYFSEVEYWDVLEQSWDALLSSSIIPFLWRGWLKGAGGWKSKESFCRNNVHTFSGRRDCHRMFKGTFLPGFHVISEAKIIILVSFLIMVRRNGPDSCYWGIFIPPQMEL